MFKRSIVLATLVFVCMTVSAQSRRGMTWTVLDQQGGYVHVGADGWTNAYQGDTSADQYLPLLCVQVDWQPAPSWISFDFYNGWVRGTLQATGPVQGYALTSRQRADEICAQNFGWGYRMAEFHDGYYGPNFEYSGGWTYWGAGSLPWGTRFWTAINDQPANPWNSGGGTPQSAAEILRGIDANALRQVALWGSDQELASYLTPIANQVADYALHKYGEDIRADIADHPESAVVLAFFYYGIEHGITAEDIENDCPSSTMAARLASPVECFAEALDDILGTDDIKNLYRDFTRGVSARTVIGAVKTMARRVAWGITIGIAVVKLAICMDWV